MQPEKKKNLKNRRIKEIEETKGRLKNSTRAHLLQCKKPHFCSLSSKFKPHYIGQSKHENKYN